MSGEGRCSPAERIRSSRTDVKGRGGEPAIVCALRWWRPNGFTRPKRKRGHPLMHKEPHEHQAHPVTSLFTTCATMVAHAAGKPLAFAICLAVVIIWAASGPMFGFSDTWQ